MFSPLLSEGDLVCFLQEDSRLIELVERYGPQNWTYVAQGLGNGRNGKSCRLRWCNQLNPAIKKEPFTEDEVITRDVAVTSAGPVLWSVSEQLLPEVVWLLYIS